MNTRSIPILVLVMALLLAACGQPAGPAPAPTEITPPQPTATPGVKQEPALDLAALIEALRAEGAMIELGDGVQQPFFAVTGRVIRVNGADVQVFEFADEADARAAAAEIAPDGSGVGTSIVDWVGTPHFYQAGRLVVLYVGEAGAVAKQLSGVLGKAVAEGAGVQPEAGTGYARLRDSLRRAGGLVEETDETLAQSIFRVPGRLLRYQGQDVQVFEFSTPDEAAAQAALVAPDGGSVGTSTITWVGTPHFFSNGTIIALFVGDDAEVLNVLETVLGLQFAGGAIVRGDPTAPPIGCQPAGGGLSFVNYKAGYCLAYPDGFQLMADNPLSVAIGGPTIGGGPEPLRAGVSIVLVGSADGRTLTEAVDYTLGDFSEFPVTRTVATLGGEPAEIVEGLPGMVMTRQVIVVHGGSIYHLTFQPFDPTFTLVLPDANALWNAVMESFAFLG